jgi:hypothetical protein
MTTRTVLAGDAAWSFSPEVPPPTVADRSQAILRLRLIDETTGQAPALPVAAATTLPGGVARASSGGLVGVVGQPSVAFYAPAIATAHVDLRVTAAGFLPLAIDRPIGAQPGYPNAFATVDLGDVALHRAPSWLSGRMVSRATGPLSGGTVLVSGIWARMQHPAIPPAAPNAMPCYAGLYSDRDTSATVARRNFTPAAAVKALLLPGVAGDLTLKASDSVGIAAGDVVAIDPGDPERVEFIGIASIAAGSSTDQPATLTLDFPLRRDHPQQATLARAVPGPGGPANAVTLAARAGDTTVWTAGLAGIGAGTTAIEIAGGGAGFKTEYQPSAWYRTATGGEGDYSLPPIHRAAAIELTATHASQPNPLIRTVVLGWGQTTVITDFVYP